jgi:hypothetical protein
MGEIEEVVKCMDRWIFRDLYVKLDCPIEGESGSLFGKARASGLIEARGESPSALRNRSFNQTEEQFRRTGWRNASA